TDPVGAHVGERLEVAEGAAGVVGAVLLGGEAPAPGTDLVDPSGAEAVDQEDDVPAGGQVLGPESRLGLDGARAGPQGPAAAQLTKWPVAKAQRKITRRQNDRSRRLSARAPSPAARPAAAKAGGAASSSRPRESDAKRIPTPTTSPE